jgi:formylglycine-generating enzyme required for sulfatase activity
MGRPPSDLDDCLDWQERLDIHRPACDMQGGARDARIDTAAGLDRLRACLNRRTPDRSKKDVEMMRAAFSSALLLAALRIGVLADEVTCGFLLPETSLEAPGPEAKAARLLAEKLTAATPVIVGRGGKFRDDGGREATLSQFGVLWYHQGDSAERTALHDAPAIEALEAYVADGGGLFLSGAALAMVHDFGIESIRPRIADGGQDGFQASIVPVETAHPIFGGLAFEGIFTGGTVLKVTERGYPAYSDFFGSGGPKGGMLLARANYADENPLVEYELGKGRIIVMGWRLPHYADRNNAHRDTLEKLTGNVLFYLADSRKWKKVVLRANPAAPKPAAGVPASHWRSLALAVNDLSETFGADYPGARDFLDRLAALQRSHDALLDSEEEPSDETVAQLEAIQGRFDALRQEALLANPLLDFERLLLIRRGAGRMGLPANWESNSSLPMTGYDNQLCVLSPVRADGKLTTLLKPEGGRFVGDVDLHFDAEKMLFSMPGANGRWQVFEMNADGSGLRELPLIHEPDVDNYDACYLPDGRVLFTSTAPFIGVPCVYGGSHVTNTYVKNHDGSIRQLTVDQEHNWCPAVLPNGRVLYLRWEYTDLPHSNSRILFHMNPDGTGQMEYYGSNSFFTNSFFYARPIPGHPTRVVGIATGHHGQARMGRMLILDPALGRHEADGVVQEIPGHGKKVPTVIKDNLADGIFPRFLHPYPLSENYFLVSAQPTPQSAWGIYLVDTFDNFLLLCEEPGYAMLEPVPLRKTPSPPVIPEKVDTRRRDALVYMSDVYRGPGLKGIPPGTVKKLRVFTYEFSYRHMGGLLGSIGMDGPWDIRRVMGTVPVEPDGSALFQVPANTPISVQPLDAEGKALQLMRSWFTAMPGEVLSCVGCHDRQNSGTPNRQSLAARRPPSPIEPWYGPVRGFSFAREVQPVLDKHCVGCHDGTTRPDGTTLSDLRGEKHIEDWSSNIAGNVGGSLPKGGRFSVSYGELHRYVRRPGIESNIRLLAPMEFHADSTELVQILRKGHHGVTLDDEAWDRLITWIDMNAPYHGTWSEIAGEDKVRHVAERARTMRKRYAGVDEDLEAIPEIPSGPIEPVVPAPPAENPAGAVRCENWPFDAAEAKRRQQRSGLESLLVDLGDGVTMRLVPIPAGAFIMGCTEGHADERPPARVEIEQPFWIGQFEVTNEQFARFDAEHDSQVEPMHGYQFGVHGYPTNLPEQPVVRVSWNQAMAFCRWLTRRTGRQFTLPTEAQWEYACRAGTATPMSYGDLDTDFSSFANLGDAKLREFALDTYVNIRLVPDPNPYDDWVPKDARFNDAGFVSVAGGRYQPNPWGLHDMHGNVCEWTRSAERAYPYDENDGRNDLSATGRKVVRGGSWYDRPKRCTSSFRLGYQAHQKAFNTGFRVICQ